MGQTSSSNDLSIFGLKDDSTETTNNYVPGVMEITGDSLVKDLKKSIICKCPVVTREMCLEKNFCNEPKPVPSPPPQIVSDTSGAKNNQEALKKAQEIRDAKLAEQKLLDEAEAERLEQERVKMEKKQREQEEHEKMIEQQRKLKEEREAEFEESLNPYDTPIESAGQSNNSAEDLDPQTVKNCQDQINTMGNVTKSAFLLMYGDECSTVADQLKFT
jgi:hypothetical protein